MVKDISSIKHNYFSFKNDVGVITDHPFVIKKAPDGSSYHFDKEDLENMSKYEIDLAPHKDEDSLSRKEYIQKMKREFYHQIRSGNMDSILSSLYKLEDEKLQLKWGGPVEPDFKI